MHVVGVMYLLDFTKFNRYCLGSEELAFFTFLSTFFFFLILLAPSLYSVFSIRPF